MARLVVLIKGIAVRTVIIVADLIMSSNSHFKDCVHDISPLKKDCDEDCDYGCSPYYE